MDRPIHYATGATIEKKKKKLKNTKTDLMF